MVMALLWMAGCGLWTYDVVAPDGTPAGEFIVEEQLTIERFERHDASGATTSVLICELRRCREQMAR